MVERQAKKTMKDESIRLTKAQREILEALRDGGTITVDRHNMPWLGTRSLSPQTRYFLTENRLVERHDRTKAVETNGNGLVISAKGLATLAAAPKPKPVSTAARVEKPPELATDRQRDYAGALGLAFPADITKSAMSELISKTVDKEGDPDPGLMEFARAHGLDVSPYVGEGALYDRVFRMLPEEDKARFFAYSVYRWGSDDREGNLDCSPQRELIDEVARQLRRNPQALKSLLRYEGRDLRFFGETTFEGVPRHGGSENTIAFKEASRLLKEHSSGPQRIQVAVEPDKQTPEKSIPEMLTSTVQDATNPFWVRIWICGLVLLALGAGYWLLRAIAN